MSYETIFKNLVTLRAQTREKAGSLSALDVRESAISRFMADGDDKLTISILDNVLQITNRNLPEVPKIDRIPSEPSIWKDYFDQKPEKLSSYTPEDIEAAQTIEQIFQEQFYDFYAALTQHTIDFLFTQNADHETYIDRLAKEFNIHGQYDLYPKILEACVIGVLERALILKNPEQFSTEENFFKIKVLQPIRHAALTKMGATFEKHLTAHKNFKEILKNNISNIIEELAAKEISSPPKISDLYECLYTQENNGMFKIQNLLKKYFATLQIEGEASYEFNNRYENQFRDALLFAFAEKQNLELDPLAIQDYCKAINESHRAYSSKEKKLYLQQAADKIKILANSRFSYSDPTVLKNNIDPNTIAEKIFVPTIVEYNIASQTERRLSNGEKEEIVCKSFNQIDKKFIENSTYIEITFNDNKSSLLQFILDFFQSFLNPKNNFKPEEVKPQKNTLFSLWKPLVEHPTTSPKNLEFSPPPAPVSIKCRA